MTERVDKNMGAIAVTLDYDAELMVRVKAGDEKSFALLLEKHRSPVIHFLYRMVQNDAVAEELAQEVFLRVYRSRSSYEPTAKFTTWLFRIATHLALNSLRDAKNQRLERDLIHQGLIRTHWNKSQLAKELGISRSNLITKVERYGLDKKTL